LKKADLRLDLFEQPGATSFFNNLSGAPLREAAARLSETALSVPPPA
jgi:hypothetical protein